jgi:hypothetical protein
MTTASRYATLANVLRDDEAVLHRAWIAHKTVHQPRCGEDCEARQVLEDARDRTPSCSHARGELLLVVGPGQ